MCAHVEPERVAWRVLLKCVCGFGSLSEIRNPDLPEELDSHSIYDTKRRSVVQGVFSIHIYIYIYVYICIYKCIYKYIYVYICVCILPLSIAYHHTIVYSRNRYPALNLSICQLHVTPRDKAPGDCHASQSSSAKYPGVRVP